MDWFDEAGNGSAVDVAALMDSDAPELLWRIATAGALVSIGRTSDGGAMNVTVTWDGRYRREYFRDSESLVDWLKPAADFVEELAAQEAASPVRRSRQRGRTKAL